MKNKRIAALFATAFALTATTLVIAAGTSKADQPMLPTYTAKWPLPDHFSVRGQDRDEVIAILKEHAKTHHDGLVLTDEKAEAMVKTIEPKN
jgi:predicted small metal-binding protein